MPGGLVERESGRVIATRVRPARSLRERARGLIGGPPLAAGEALLIERGRQVHTFGMRYSIDVCFLDRSDRVVHLVRDMRPRRVSRWVPRARRVVEMAAGGMDGVQVGAQLSVELSDR